MISIIIPAHNEQSVIARGLRAIVTGARPGEIEVIVACNGCTDRTAEIARSFGEFVRVLEIAQASKVAALNAADEVAAGFPRFYVDADVVLDLPSIRLIAEALARGDALMATPQLRMDLSRTTWPVRAFYRFWSSLAYNREGGAVGTGVYVLSREGRARFDRFPDVIADDGFVRFQFPPHERMTVEGAFSVVDPPANLPGLIRIKTRARLGKYAMAQRYPSLATSDPRPRGGLLGHTLRRPGLWPCLPVYLAVGVAIRWRARRMLERLSTYVWERDESARVG